MKFSYLWTHIFLFSQRSAVVRPIAVSNLSDSRKRKSSQDVEGAYEGSWAMRPKPPTTTTPPPSSTPSSSEEASAPGLEEENKDEMLNIYFCMVDALLRSADEERPLHSARNELNQKLGQYDANKNKDMRLRLLKHFQSQGKEARDLVGLFRLLDVILDDHMDLVEIPCRDEDGCECFDNRILPIIIKRCPNLGKLHFRCSNGLVGFTF